MINAKHTPGPWKVDGSGRVIYSEKSSSIVASTVGERNRGIEEADARLIASAPELLVALQDAIDALAVHAPEAWALTQARAAIAKAIG